MESSTVLHQSINPSNTIVKIEASLLSAFSFNFSFRQVVPLPGGMELSKEKKAEGKED